MRNRKHRDETSYTYYAYDPETKKETRHVLTAGEDGVTEEWIILLQEMDHAEGLQERYNEENADYRDWNYKAAVHNGNNGAINPLDELAYEQFMKGDPEENPKIDEVRDLIWDSLTDEQIDLVYQIYGARRMGTEIAAEQGVSQQAIDGRNRRIRDKIRKLIEDM